MYLSAGLIQHFVIIGIESIGEGDQFGCVRNGNFGLAVDALQVVSVAGMFAARTEQYCMAGGSVDALVDGGHPRREELDLGVRQVAVFVAEIAQRGVRQVLRGIEMPEEGDASSGTRLSARWMFAPDSPS